jgi:hypothetical protein
MSGLTQRACIDWRHWTQRVREVDLGFESACNRLAAGGRRVTERTRREASESGHCQRKTYIAPPARAAIAGGSPRCGAIASNDGASASLRALQPRLQRALAHLVLHSRTADRESDESAAAGFLSGSLNHQEGDTTMEHEKAPPGKLADARAKVAKMAEKGGHQLQERTEKVGHKAREIATRVIHSAQESAQKVVHRATEAGTTVRHRREELSGKAADKPKGA